MNRLTVLGAVVLTLILAFLILAFLLLAACDFGEGSTTQGPGIEIDISAPKEKKAKTAKPKALAVKAPSKRRKL